MTATQLYERTRCHCSAHVKMVDSKFHVCVCVCILPLFKIKKSHSEFEFSGRPVTPSPHARGPATTARTLDATSRRGKGAGGTAGSRRGQRLRATCRPRTLSAIGREQADVSALRATAAREGTRRSWDKREVGREGPGTPQRRAGARSLCSARSRSAPDGCPRGPSRPHAHLPGGRSRPSSPCLGTPSPGDPCPPSRRGPL